MRILAGCASCVMPPARSLPPAWCSTTARWSTARATAVAAPMPTPPNANRSSFNTRTPPLDRGLCSKSQVRHVSVGSAHPAVVVTDHAPPEMNQSVCDLAGMGVATTIATGVAKDVGYESSGRTDDPGSKVSPGWSAPDRIIAESPRARSIGSARRSPRRPS